MVHSTDCTNDRRVRERIAYRHRWRHDTLVGIVSTCRFQGDNFSNGPRLGTFVHALSIRFRKGRQMIFVFVLLFFRKSCCRRAFTASRAAAASCSRRALASWRRCFSSRAGFFDTSLRSLALTMLGRKARLLTCFFHRFLFLLQLLHACVGLIQSSSCPLLHRRPSCLSHAGATFWLAALLLTTVRCFFRFRTRNNGSDQQQQPNSFK